MWSDNETSVDLLNAQHLVSAVTDIIRNERLLPVTVGIFGGWGSGKSSLIQMIREDLEPDQDVLCVTFNGWLFEGFEDAKAALMGTILDDLTDNRKLGPKAKDLASKLLERIDWFRLLRMAGKNIFSFAVTGFPSIDTLRDVKELVTKNAEGLVKDSSGGEESFRRTVREFRDDFAELLEESKIETLVVFIDDLDRCLPPTVIDTLEAIKLFLFVEQTVFIIGADEDLVQHAVKLRFPEINESKLYVGRDYLEKLVQIPVRIPPLSRSEIETYMNLLFAELHLQREEFTDLLARLPELSHDNLLGVRFNYAIAARLLKSMPDGLGEDLVLAQQIADVITTGLSGNPRQTKRFLNTLLMRVKMAQARGMELSRRVLAKLMLLEYFRTESFRMLAGLQAAQEGKPEELRIAELTLVRDEVPENSDGNVETAVTSVSGEKEGIDFIKRNKDTVQAKESASTRSEDLSFPVDWFSDTWLRAWLLSEPMLRDVDLRPHFYFSRERIGILSGPKQRMSPAALKVLTGLASRSESKRIAAGREASKISSGDAAAIFQELAERTRRAEDLTPDNSPLKALLSLVAHRKELVGELVIMLRSLPHRLIPIEVIPEIVDIFQGTEAVSSARELMGAWKASNENLLARATATVIDHLN